MKCPSCQEENQDNTGFCESCGEELAEVSVKRTDRKKRKFAFSWKKFLYVILLVAVFAGVFMISFTIVTKNLENTVRRDVIVHESQNVDKNKK